MGRKVISTFYSDAILKVHLYHFLPEKFLTYYLTTIFHFRKIVVLIQPAYRTYTSNTTALDDR